MIALLVGVVARGALLAGSPPPITREGAQRAARAELAKPIYQHSKPPWWARPVTAVLHWVGRVLAAAARGVGGPAALLVIILIVVLVAAFVFWRIGVPARRARAAALAPAGPSTADDHRAAARAHAAAGRWAEAVREDLRAVLRQLEERAVIDRRAGRTATELARDGGAALPAVADQLRTAAELFNAIWYGDRAATAADHEQLVRLDEAVRRARPRLDTAVGAVGAVGER